MAGEIKKFSDEVNIKLDNLGKAVDGVVDDVAFLKEVIEKLQTNPGPITPEDQALLDAAQARVSGLSDKVAALDAATERPPTPPVP